MNSETSGKNCGFWIMFVKSLLTSNDLTACPLGSVVVVPSQLTLKSSKTMTSYVGWFDKIVCGLRKEGKKFGQRMITERPIHTTNNKIGPRFGSDLESDNITSIRRKV